MKRIAMLVLGLISPAAAQNVTTYHNGIDRSGAYVVPGLTHGAASFMHLDLTFHAVVSGNVYAQPLYWQPPGPGGAPAEIIVATESNDVEAFNAVTGAVIWTHKLPPPVPQNDLGCGNVIPEGVTGTPVIDPATGALYVDALIESYSNGPRQYVYALSATTGALLPHWPIDVETSLAKLGDSFTPYTQGERSALLLLNGNLYISYGGRFGDCGTYHGTVVQVSAADGAIGGFWQTRAHGGGIWSQGGPVSDGTSIYVTTGNTMGAPSWEDGEAIIKLSPGLAHSTATADYFTPTDWSTNLDANDLDLGGTGAIPISVPASGGGSAVARMLALGKDGNAYLADATNLGGIGGQLATVPISGGEIITAPAVYATSSRTMVAFTNMAGKSCGGSSISMLAITPSSLSEVWCGYFNGAGAPIITTTDGVSDPIVWVFGAEGDEQLHGFDALKGTVLFAGGGSKNTVPGVRHFTTLIAAGGRLYVAGQGRIYAFAF
jgi:hypothetical protein